MTILILNGAKFAQSESEFTESLFHNDGTCVGYFKPRKSSIALLDHNRELIGVINKYGCLCAATKLNGRTWYSFATIRQIGEYKSYIKSVDESADALRRYCSVNA